MSEPGLPRGLYAVVDDGIRPELPLPEKARLLARAGVQVAQLRCKRGRAREAWKAVRESVRIRRAKNERSSCS